MREISTEALQDYLPHRPPAVWVDAVQIGPLQPLTADGGECVVRLRPDATYAKHGRILPSSYVEWMAQAFGFSQAAWRQEQGIVAGTRKAFLVAINGFQVLRPGHPAILGEVIRINTRRTHQLGPIAVVECRITSSSQETLAIAKLKLYGEES